MLVIIEPLISPHEILGAKNRYDLSFFPFNKSITFIPTSRADFFSEDIGLLNREAFLEIFAMFRVKICT